MIHTISFRRWRAAIGQRGCSDATGARLAAEEGFTLIEVIVSVLLVAFIAVATFNGFDVANRTTADQRHRNQAAVLAAQSEESLRSDSAYTLDKIQLSPSEYTQTVGGEKYTIIQEDEWVNDSHTTVPCSATTAEAHANQNGDYLRITSKVRWEQQIASNRPAVSQTSIITPPDGSGLEVDVTNGATPLQPVSGVTAIANGVSLSTGASGCVIFGAIPATRVAVEAFKLGDVTPSGAFKKVSKELLITPNVTTHYPVTLAPGGNITAEFEHEGKPAQSDTFVVFNTKMNEIPNFEVGSTGFTYETSGAKESQFTAKTGTYASTATTFIESKHYATGNLFPFPSSAWGVYAGDCPTNSPSNYKIEPSSIYVKAGEGASVKVPMSYVNLRVFEGTQSTPKLQLLAGVEPYEIKITNTGCSSEKAPNNAVAANLTHTQHVSTAGKLSYPAQPFGEAEICLLNSVAKKTYKVKYTNKTIEGSTVNVYLSEGSPKERQELREKEEKEEKELREKEEKSEKEKKTAREKEAKTEKEAREKLEKESVKGATKAAREKEEKEKSEKVAKLLKEEKEKGELRAAQEKEEKEKRELREKQEKEKQTKREKEVKEEAEAAPREDTVEAHQISC